MHDFSPIFRRSSRRRLRRHWLAANLVAKAAKRELLRLRVEGKVRRKEAAELPVLTTGASTVAQQTIGQMSAQRNRIGQILRMLRDRCQLSERLLCRATIIVPGRTRQSHASNTLRRAAHMLTRTQSQKDMFTGSHLRRGKGKATKSDHDPGR